MLSLSASRRLLAGSSKSFSRLAGQYFCSRNRFCTRTRPLNAPPRSMAPTPVPLPRDTCDALGLDHEEAAFREGSATIVLPSKEAAFLNPVQEFNRDLSILAIRTWGDLVNEEKRKRFEHSREKRAAKGSKKRSAANGHEAESATNGEASNAHQKRQRIDDAQAAAGEASSRDLASDLALSDAAHAPAQQGPSTQTQAFRDYRFTILEALSATGLRSIRYAREIPQLRYVVANDLSSSAVDAMKRNVALNFPPDRPIAVWEPEEAGEKANVKDAAAGDAQSNASSTKKSLDQSIVADVEAAVSFGALTKRKGSNGTSAPGEKELVPHPDCRVRLNEGDAITLMYNHREERKRFDVVDLDPYGSATMFLDAAVQSVSDGGLLCVTCTDSAVLAGTSYPEKAFSAYGGVTTKSEYSHESALRLVLHAISASAARYGRYVQPMLSLSIDFYVRLFVRVYTRPAEVKRLASQTGCVFTCSHCQLASPMPFGRHLTTETRSGQAQDKYQVGLGPKVGPTCHECGSPIHTAGPMWLGKIHDVDFCKRMLATLDKPEEQKRFRTVARIRGMVGIAADELPGDVAPFYFTPSKVSNFFHTQSPPLALVVSALLHAGFSVSRAHAAAGSLKTTAPRETLYDLYRAWIRDKASVKMENVSRASPAYTLLTGQSHRQDAAPDQEDGGEKAAQAAALTEHAPLLPPKLEWNLDVEHPDTKRVLEGTSTSASLAGGAKSTKYQVNPLPNWGPGTAARATPRAK